MTSARIFHYRIALASGAFIAVSAVTGLLWAYAPHLYWQPRYKEKKAGGAQVFVMSEVQTDTSALRHIVSSRAGSERIKGMALKYEIDRPYFDIRVDGAPGRLLVDAKSGEVVSPLSRDLAIAFARQYVQGPPGEAEAQLVSDWEDRKHATHPSVWLVRFSDDRNTEIVLDPASGEILEDSDSVRRFHFWVMRLHQFSFFGTHKTLTAMSGVPLLALLVTGVVLGWKRLRVSAR